MKLARFFLTGIFFGIVLTKAEAVSWYRIYEMFHFQSFHMFGIIGMALFTGVLGIQLIKRFKIKDFNGFPIQIIEKEWEKIYEIDLLNDPQYAEYKDVVKDIKLNGVSYVITSYQNDEVVKGGKVEIYLGAQTPETNTHIDFFDDLSKGTVYQFNNKDKIAIAQTELSNEKKIVIKAKVILDEQPSSPITISFDFKLDVDLGVDLSNIK